MFLAGQRVTTCRVGIVVSSLARRVGQAGGRSYAGQMSRESKCSSVHGSISNRGLVPGGSGRRHLSCLG